MRHLDCERCARDIPRGHYTNPPGPDGPAESYRVIEGRAKHPTPAVRVIRVNGHAEQLPIDHFDCDLCGAPIRPGDRAVCLTAWRTREQPEPPAWELDYLDLGESDHVH